MTYRLVVFYPLDPRGTKVGGIETHIRLILENFPADFDVLFVGIDEIGDRALRVAAPLSLGSRIVDFCPVARVPADRINLAARSLWRSTTFRFVLGAFWSLPSLHAMLRGRSASADLQRFEAALLPRFLGIPAVQMVHGEGSKNDKMDSLIKKLWFLHALNERLALRLAARILCVNENIIRRIRREFGNLADKAELLTVSVDTRVFAPRPFDLADGIFRVIFAGRLDEFKDPPLMFRCFAELHSRLSGQFEFHYVGASDPSRYEDFAKIEACTIRHGFQPPAGVAAIAGRCHAGVLTSFFEGMPCFLLEVLSVGRPFVAIRLPQFDPLVIDGVSGHLVERGADAGTTARELADAFIALWEDIRSGKIKPDAVHAMIGPYTVENQMSRLFDIHRQLQKPVIQAVASRESTTRS
jgi:glycosyltransferase involved in cell wall biosynthesis